LLKTWTASTLENSQYNAGRHCGPPESVEDEWASRVKWALRSLFCAL
jgi:hypothetical protein